MTGPDPAEVVAILDADPPQLSGYVIRDYDELIAAVDAARDRQGITLTALAAAVGGHRQQVRRWLRGDNEPSARRLFALTDAISYDVALIPREKP